MRDQEFQKDLHGAYPILCYAEQVAGSKFSPMGFFDVEAKQDFPSRFAEAVRDNAKNVSPDLTIMEEPFGIPCVETSYNRAPTDGVRRIWTSKPSPDRRIEGVVDAAPYRSRWQ